MTANRRTLIASATGAIFAVAILTLPASTGVAAEKKPLPILGYDFTDIAPPAAAVAMAEPAVAAVAPVATPAALSSDPETVTCMAKVVHHEARNQPRSGQIAVAQTLINRLHAGGRFGNSICDVANQHGQFFNTAAYRPNEDSDTWQQALSVSRETLSGQADAVAPGAMFFRAAYSPTNSFFRTRQRVTAVGDHVFYR